MVSRAIGILGFSARDTAPIISGDKTVFVANQIVGWMITLLSVVDESKLYTGEGYYRRSQEREKLESLSCTVNLTRVQSKWWAVCGRRSKSGEYV